MQTLADYLRGGSRRVRAFQKIAAELGNEHPITKMMGSLSYGRHDFEIGATITLRKAIAQWAFLEGSFSILNQWARDHDAKAQQSMLRIWHDRT